jgi:hypothetical protein
MIEMRQVIAELPQMLDTQVAEGIYIYVYVCIYIYIYMIQFLIRILSR